MKLSRWAKKQGISYLTAYRWFKSGKIANAHQTESGTILVSDKEDEMLQRNADIFSIFDDIFDSAYSRRQNENRFKIINEQNQYLVMGEVPGFKEDEIKISVKNNILGIFGSHEINKDEKYFSKETSKFTATYALPTDVNIDDITAEHEYGVLKIVIPKTVGTKQMREIPIKQLNPAK